jgi:choline kinase
MRALLLAAGRGERLRPYTDERPKCLVPFAGRPLLEWQLAALRSTGITEIGVVAGYRADTLEPYGLRTWVNALWDRTNMVESLFCAREWIAADEPLVVSYTDIAYEPRLLAALLDTPGDIVVAVDRQWLDLWAERHENVLSDAESLRIGAGGALIDIGRRVDRVEDIEAQYIGLLRFSAEGLALLRNFWASASGGAAWLQGRPLERAAMTDLLRGMIDAGLVIAAAVVDRGWLEVDSVSDLQLYERWHADGTLDRFFSPAATTASP